MSPRRYLPILAALAAGAPSATHAFDRQTQAMLKRLDPDTRVIQACDLEAMRRIDRDPNRFHPERVAIDQIAPPSRNGRVLQGTGGVFRSGGDWYQLSFMCRTSDDGLSVLSFSYEIGPKIDRSRWDELNLYP